MKTVQSEFARWVAPVVLSYAITGALTLAQAQGGGNNVKDISGLNCATGAIIKFDGSNWVCAADGTGITNITAGRGLHGGGSTPSVTLSLDTNFVQTKPQNVKVVAKSGGDFSTVGAALASITDNNANNRYLVLVAPGTYNEAVTLKPYVHVKGAGQGITVITSTVSTAFGTVLSVANCALSDLTVINADSSGSHLAIRSGGGLFQNVTVIAEGASSWGLEISGGSLISPITLQNVTVQVNGGSNSVGIGILGGGRSNIQNSTVTVTGSGVNRGILVQGSANIGNTVVVVSGTGDNTGVYADHGGGFIRNSVITASGGSNTGIFIHDGGIDLANSSVTATGGTSNIGIRDSPYTGATITNSTITASGGTNSVGVAASEINMTVDASRLIGGTAALTQSSNPFGSIKIGASMLKGAVNASGQFACVGAYNGNYVGLNSICQ